MLAKTHIRIAACIAVGIVATLSACDRDTPTTPTALATSPTVNHSVASPSAPSSKSSYEIKTFGTDVASGNLGTVEVLCTVGKKALGGGFQIGGPVLIDPPDVVVYENSPRVTSGTDGWRLSAVNRTADLRHFDVWVICANM